MSAGGAFRRRCRERGRQDPSLFSSRRRHTIFDCDWSSDVCSSDLEVASLDEANDILALLMRHWNDIAHTLGKDEVYVPLLLEDENGVTRGNDWARGFLQIGSASCRERG